MDTREWSDGVLTAAAREVVKDSNALAWIICDGDVDPEWIEALNSVLDDNRLVCLLTCSNNSNNGFRKHTKIISSCRILDYYLTTEFSLCLFKFFWWFTQVISKGSRFLGTKFELG